MCDLNDAAARKARANLLMKEGDYMEAITEYSEAIALDPANPVLYSNRSLAFLNLEQYFFSLKDAETTIRLIPDWAKGYYRKGQAESGAKMYKLAIKSYNEGLELCPSDNVLKRALDECQDLADMQKIRRRKKLRKYTILAGLFGCFLVIFDLLWSPRFSFIRHPWLRGILMSVSAFVGYLLGTIANSFEDSGYAILLHPPNSLMTGEQLDYCSTSSACSSGDCETSKMK